MISTYAVAPFRPRPTERLGRQLWTRPSGAGVAPTGFAPAADVYREGDDLVARFDLPGVDPERDVTVELEGRRLVVRGERRDQRVVEAPADEASDDAEQAEDCRTRMFDIDFELRMDDSNRSARIWPLLIEETGSSCGGSNVRRTHRFTLDPKSWTYSFPDALQREGCE